MLTKVKIKINEIKWYLITGISSGLILFFMLSIRSNLNLTKESPFTELIQIFASITAICIILFFTWFINFMSDILFGDESSQADFYCPYCSKTINSKHVPSDRSEKFQCPHCRQSIISKNTVN